MTLTSLDIAAIVLSSIALFVIIMFALVRVFNNRCRIYERKYGRTFHKKSC